MPSASNTSNSSNIRSSELKISVNRSTDGSRLLVNLTNQSPGFLAPGLAAGDVIRFDVSLNGYTRADATSVSKSEVFGVIESLNIDGSLNVVTYGSIAYPVEKLINLDGFNFGGNDVYFLSDTLPGRLQNLPPSNLGNIVKPVYQKAPHGDAFTGSVVNYVGYSIINTG
jgi:hypothetical protein